VPGKDKKLSGSVNSASQLLPPLRNHRHQGWAPFCSMMTREHRRHRATLAMAARGSRPTMKSKSAFMPRFANRFRIASSRCCAARSEHASVNTMKFAPRIEQISPPAAMKRSLDCSPWSTRRTRDGGEQESEPKSTGRVSLCSNSRKSSPLLAERSALPKIKRSPGLVIRRKSESFPPEVEAASQATLNSSHQRAHAIAAGEVGPVSGTPKIGRWNRRAQSTASGNTPRCGANSSNSTTNRPKMAVSSPCSVAGDVRRDNVLAKKQTGCRSSKRSGLPTND
jgi:hypothetical protein